MLPIVNRTLDGRGPESPDRCCGLKRSEGGSSLPNNRKRVSLQPGRFRISWFSALVMAGLETLASPHRSACAAAPPNVVLILADDLGWGELGCYGQKRIRTPNIDRLPAEGIRFTQHYSGAPVCAPSRNVLLTGLHLGHAEIRGNRQAVKGGEGQWPIADETQTIAEVLKTAGYRTGAFGKWGLGPVGSTGDPNRQGFDFFFGYNCQSMAHSYFPPHLWRNREKIAINAQPIPGHARRAEGEVRMRDWQGENYAPDLIEAEAVRFIERNRSRPFFLYCAFTEPHVALHPPERLVNSYPREWDSQPYRGQNGYLPHPRPRAAYAALITSLDEHVGRVLDAIDRHGLTSNTVVVFTSDNGTTHPGADPTFGIGGVDAAFFNSTRGLRGYKGSVYEGGIRVPLIVRWPGRVRAGSISGFPSYFADHFPTLCEVARVSPASRGDGVSLLPVLLSAEQGSAGARARPPMVWVFPEYGGQVAVRTGDFKVVRQRLGSKTPGPWEVYDISADPAESTDISASHADVIARAKEILKTETSDNSTFPVVIPAVNDPRAR